MIGGYKAKYEEANKGNQQKEAEISDLKGQLLELQGKFNTQTSSHNTEKLSLETEREGLKKKIADLEEKNTALSGQLRNEELSRFASAYEIQEKEYQDQQDLWFNLSLGATGLLTVSVLISIFGPHFAPSHEWYKEPAFYLLDVIFLTLFVYSLKQHSHLGNLRIDYANRKTLAQSYQYIIEDEEETSEVRKRFLERAADVFTSKVIPRSNDVTIYEALVAKILGGK